MASIQKFSKNLQELWSAFKTEEDLQHERLEEMLTDIIREYRLKGARSNEIARAIIQFVKKYGMGG